MQLLINHIIFVLFICYLCAVVFLRHNKAYVLGDIFQDLYIKSATAVKIRNYVWENM